VLHISAISALFTLLNFARITDLFLPLPNFVFRTSALVNSAEIMIGLYWFVEPIRVFVSC